VLSVRPLRRLDARACRSDTKVQPVADYLRQELGVRDLGRLVTRCPALLSSSLDRKLRPTVAFLLSQGLTVADFDRMLVKHPALFTHRRAPHACGVDTGTRMLLPPRQTCFPSCALHALTRADTRCWPAPTHPHTRAQPERQDHPCG
jgi:hypothetical protein